MNIKFTLPNSAVVEICDITIDILASGNFVCLPLGDSGATVTFTKNAVVVSPETTEASAPVIEESATPEISVAEEPVAPEVHVVEEPVAEESIVEEHPVADKPKKKRSLSDIAKGKKAKGRKAERTASASVSSRDKDNEDNEEELVIINEHPVVEKEKVEKITLALNNVHEILVKLCAINRNDPKHNFCAYFDKRVIDGINGGKQTKADIAMVAKAIGHEDDMFKYLTTIMLPYSKTGLYFPTKVMAETYSDTTLYYGDKETGTCKYVIVKGKAFLFGDKTKTSVSLDTIDEEIRNGELKCTSTLRQIRKEVQ